MSPLSLGSSTTDCSSFGVSVTANIQYKEVKRNEWMCTIRSASHIDISTVLGGSNGSTKDNETQPRTGLL